MICLWILVIVSAKPFASTADSTKHENQQYQTTQGNLQQSQTTESNEFGLNLSTTLTNTSLRNHIMKRGDFITTYVRYGNKIHIKKDLEVNHNGKTGRIVI